MGKLYKLINNPKLFFVDFIKNMIRQVFVEQQLLLQKKTLKISGQAGNTLKGKIQYRVGFSTIKFLGENNSLLIGKNVSLHGCDIIFTSSNASLEIGDNSILKGTIRVNRDCSIVIGRNVKINQMARIHASEKARILIGDNCLFANVNIRTSDSHFIVDLSTNKRINPSADVVIGDNVWVAENSSIYKGVSIGNGSIIGAAAVVTKDIPPNSLAVGVPARVIKNNVSWFE